MASADDCANYYEGPIHVALNQDIGSMEMLETLEISFDLKINTECVNTEHSWCHLFAIGGRLPLLYTFSGALYSHFLPGSCINCCCYDGIPEIYATMIDGNYHTFHLKYTETERIITFDNITYIQIDNAQNNILQHLHRSYAISAVWGSGSQYATDATIKHLCINPKSIETNTTTTDSTATDSTATDSTTTDSTTTDSVREMTTALDMLTTNTEHTGTYNPLEMTTVPDMVTTTTEHTSDTAMSIVSVLLLVAIIVLLCLCISVGVWQCMRYKTRNAAKNTTEVNENGTQGNETAMPHDTYVQLITLGEHSQSETESL